MAEKTLSFGQRQLICLPRAVLKNSKIVVLDEVTAVIDQIKEQSLNNVIKKSFTHSTVITIAHKLDTVMECDRYFRMLTYQFYNLLFHFEKNNGYKRRKIV